MQSAGTPPSLKRGDTVEQLGKYRLIALLAHGGMGDVYLAVVNAPLGFSKLLVVKELKHESLDDDARVAMFLDEARLAARLSHPNVVQTIEVGEDGNRRFIAMEYLDGQPLNRLVHRSRKVGTPLPLEMHCHVLLDMLTALEYAHSLAEFDGSPLGIVHRDVSPQNVFVTYDGPVKLIDFGVAKASSASQQTNAGILKGKIRYMAPEQTTSHPVDRRADVFAAGLMLWEAVAGWGPWEGAPDIAVLRSLMSGSVPRLRVVRPDLDPDLTAIVDRATSPDPAARYPSALAMRDDLEGYMNDRGLILSSQRALPAFAARMFAEDRRALRDLIESQMRVVEECHPPEVEAASGMRPREPVGESPSSVESPPVPLPLPEYQPPSLAATALSVRPPILSHNGRVFVSGAGVTCAVILALVLPYKRAPVVKSATVPAHATVAPATAPTPAREPLAPAPVAPPSAETMAHLTLKASPPWAQLYLDDRPVQNPDALERPRDRATHFLRAEASGYATKVATFAVEGDVHVEIALERLLATLPSPARHTNWPVATRARSAAAPLAEMRFDGGVSDDSELTKPRREVDKANPYTP